MTSISMKDLLEAGAHFGHRTRSWNPHMQPYIYMVRNGIHIIDLQQTKILLQEACTFVEQVVGQGGMVLFVGTKKQAGETVAEEARRSNMPYVSQRWMGGMLTNFKTMQLRVEYLKMLEERRDSGEFELLPKKEAQQLQNDIMHLERLFGGVRHMRYLPNVVFIVDTVKEHTAVLEARRLGIPIVALVDTNCDPNEVDYPIPANDDAIRTIKLITAALASSAKLGVDSFIASKKDNTVQGDILVEI